MTVLYYPFPALNRGRPICTFFELTPPSFNDDELRRIVDLAETKPAKPAKGTSRVDGASSYDPHFQQRRVAAIDLCSDSQWIYDRLVREFAAQNSKYFCFDISGLERLLYSVYDAAEGGHLGPHMDVEPVHDRPARKMTMTIQLSSPSEYDGGDLIFNDHNDHSKAFAARKALGAQHLFAAFQFHRVAPVTRGVRRSLTVFAVGPSFR